MAEAGAELMDGLDKTALLLLIVGEKKAAEILRHMEPKEIQQIGAAMAERKKFTPEMVSEVMRDFIQAFQHQTSLGLDADDYIREMMTEALGPDKAGTVIDRILLGRNSRGIEQLKWMDARAISDLIRQEHPQIIAIVVALLEPDQSAAVLAYLPEKVRPDIIMRIATLEGVQPAALRELDDIMEKQLSGNSNVKSSTIGGIDAAASILNFLESAIEANVMEQVSEMDADISQRIQDKMFVFDDLVDIDDRGIQTLLREVSTDALLLALRAAEDALKEKIFRNMSRRAAEMLREDLEAAAPAKVSDVEASQKEILAIARRLAEAGEISLGGSDELI